MSCCLLTKFLLIFTFFFFCISLPCLQTVGEKDQRLVIVNLQRTPLDPLAKLLIHAKCDDVSKLLMTKLGLPIPQFTLKRLVGAERLPGRSAV